MLSKQMICKDFENWVLIKDVFANKNTPADITHKNHMANCKACADLYAIDQAMENNIKSSFSQEQLPDGLYDQVDITINHAQTTKPQTTKPMVNKYSMAGLAAGFILVVVMATFFFLNQPFQYKNLQQLGETAIFKHLDGNTTMVFTADKMDHALVTMSKTLKFNVTLPDLNAQDYVLLGGRSCVLGKCKIAYIFYKRQDKISSLFILGYDQLAFEMADGSRFSNDIKGYHTDIWKENGQVYAMVY